MDCTADYIEPMECTNDCSKPMEQCTENIESTEYKEGGGSIDPALL